MNQKINCKKCNLLIDSDMKYCPYCGYPQDETEEKTEEAPQPVERKELEYVPPKKVKFFDYPVLNSKVSIIKSIILFFLGLIGFNLLGMVYSLIMSNLGNYYFVETVNFSASINFSLYILMFGTCLIILNSDLAQMLVNLKKAKKRQQGISFGFLMLIVSSTVSLIMNAIHPSGVNNNESGIESITAAYPLLSILVLGILGPFVEEVTYRVGLFNSLSRWNRIVAYIGTAVIFGLIHFDFTSTDIITELVNIPSYIVSGLLLCYFYEYGGFEASFLAHATNNLFAVIIQILARSNLI